MKASMKSMIRLVTIFLVFLAHTTAAGSVEENYVTEQIILGGVQQTILIRGQNTGVPVLLFLHGGPSNSEMPVAHKYLPNLEKHFIV